MAKQVMNMGEFRSAFSFANRNIAHYFPGHMAKGLVDMQKKLKDVDCIIEVHDARIPFTGRNPKFQSTLAVRPHLLLLNKMDLADLRQRSKIEDGLKEQGVENVMFVNCKQQIRHTIQKQVIPTVLKMIHSEPRFHRDNMDEYNLMIIGVPNVGKSSLINALRRNYLKKGKATTVGGEAGITRSVLEKIKILESPKIYVYDTPGIMMPLISHVQVGMKLALCGTLKDHLVGSDLISDYLLYWLNRNKNYSYVDYFGLSEPTDDILEILTHICKKNKLVMKKRNLEEGGVSVGPNLDQAAVRMVHAFRNGQLGRVNLDLDFMARYHDIEIECDL